MKKFLIKVNGTHYEVEVEDVLDNSTEVIQPVNEVAPKLVPVSSSSVAKRSANTSNSVSKEAKPIIAVMPGTILKVNVNSGDTVKKGKVLFILESMKMENEIAAPADGIVASVNVEKDMDVRVGDILASLIYD